ncbi:MAG: thioredoxin domain-containing protein [Lewinellaceae bacterium]|nr:thioredoxin domain-containing protein [Phaeodactylibacter sp.]MCB9042127.1 thioredoxin domain-containing protein [Lewinellaceae bacterium]
MKTSPILTSLLLLLLWACNAQTGQEQHPYTNALINESSPYLLQHAHNPVNWSPWGEAALKKAQEEDKLLIISVGYAACHWCHVMEEESFEDTTIARIMNENFVAIKVDREERPDVDGVYMTACQMASEGSCGWPLNAFALPDGRPVWAGTYFPKDQWKNILEYFVKVYQEERGKLEDYAGRLTEGIQASGRPQPAAEDALFTQKTLAGTVEAFLANIDFKKGGRKGAPKFPVPNNYEFLLQYHHLAGNEKALEAVTATLDNMSSGGIYDHLGGGFARYSTDSEWKVPHFEKMLYDNAQLASLYSEAYQVTQKGRYREVVFESLEFIERELTSPEGGFYSSLDADSEGEEGKFYTWQKSEIDSILEDERQSAVFCGYYQVEKGGNWEETNILYTGDNIEKILTEYNLTLDEILQLLTQARQKLFEARAKRIRPRLDDKILTSWNALMMQGYLDAYRAFAEPAFLEKALKNGQFIVDNMLAAGGRLDRNYKDGKSSINGFLDDYAFTIHAFISLYETTFDVQWLQRAEGLAQYTLAHFRDEKSGLFFYTSDLDPPLIARKMELEDNVIPASNSAMARALHRLGTLLYNKDYLEISANMLQSMAPRFTATTQPQYFSNWCALYAEQAFPYYEIAIVGPDYQNLRNQLGARYLPNAVLLGGPDEGRLELLKGKLQGGETFIYVCKQNVCKLPVQGVEAALGQMGL